MWYGTFNRCKKVLQIKVNILYMLITNLRQVKVAYKCDQGKMSLHLTLFQFNTILLSLLKC